MQRFVVTSIDPPMSDTNADIQSVATRLRAAIESADLEAYAALLDQNVRWGPADETPETCHSLRRSWSGWPDNVKPACRRNFSRSSPGLTRSSSD